VIQSDWIDVSLGSHHTCGVRSNGTAWCWGWNGHGHLGDGTGTNRPLGVQVSGMTSGVTDIEAAVSHQADGNWYDFTCATRNGEVWCWGRNANGQLGDGTTTQRSLPVQVQVDNNDDGTGDGVLTGVTQLSTGGIKSCAIAGANNTAYCWGYNGFYSVAVAPNTNRTRAVPVRAPDGNGAMTGVRDIMVSEYEASSTYFIVQPGTQAYGEGFAMGDNRYGQLGDGTTTNTTGWATPIYQR
jgi:alpha-tubulin suppressor-like RCC1 family protein